MSTSVPKLTPYNDAFPEPLLLNQDDLLRNKLLPHLNEFVNSGARFLVIWRNGERLPDSLEIINQYREMRCSLGRKHADFVLIERPEALLSNEVIHFMVNHDFAPEALQIEFIFWPRWQNLYQSLLRKAKENSGRWFLVTKSPTVSSGPEILEQVKSLSEWSALYLEGCNDAFLFQAKNESPHPFLMLWLWENGWSADEMFWHPITGI